MDTLIIVNAFSAPKQFPSYLSYKEDTVMDTQMWTNPLTLMFFSAFIFISFHHCLIGITLPRKFSNPVSNYHEVQLECDRARGTAEVMWLECGNFMEDPSVTNQ